MSTIQLANRPGEYEQGETACGATIMVTPGTPHIRYRDEIVYFCGEDCIQLYEADPQNSCMAARLLSSR
jgi:hypothetical protein